MATSHAYIRLTEVTTLRETRWKDALPSSLYTCTILVVQYLPFLVSPEYELPVRNSILFVAKQPQIGISPT